VYTIPATMQAPGAVTPGQATFLGVVQALAPIAQSAISDGKVTTGATPVSYTPTAYGTVQTGGSFETIALIGAAVLAVVLLVKLL